MHTIHHRRKVYADYPTIANAVLQLGRTVAIKVRSRCFFSSCGSDGGSSGRTEKRAGWIKSAIAGSRVVMLIVCKPKCNVKTPCHHESELESFNHNNNSDNGNSSQDLEVIIFLKKL